MPINIIKKHTYIHTYIHRGQSTREITNKQNNAPFMQNQIFKS